MDFTRDGRLVTAGRDQITRIWNQDGKQLLETKPIGELAVSVAYSNESHRAIAASLAGVVEVYNDDKAAMQGSLSTNPPTLDARLATSKKACDEKTAKSAPLQGAVQKAQAQATATQYNLASAQQKRAKLKSESERLAADLKQINDSRAANDAERAKAAASLQQIDAAKPSIAEALRNLTEALGKLPNDAKLAAAQPGLGDQLKTMEANSAALQAKITELTVAITATDPKLKDLNARLEATNEQSATVAAEIKTLIGQLQNAAAQLDAARKAAAPAEAELANARESVARWQNEIMFRDKWRPLKKT